jgi:hypothetical protein
MKTLTYKEIYYEKWITTHILTMSLNTKATFSLHPQQIMHIRFLTYLKNNANFKI